MAYGLPQQWAGKLDRRVTILKSTYSYVGANEPEETWLPVKTLFAQVVHFGVREMMDGEAIRAVKMTKFNIRYREDINEKDRIEHEGKQYKIVGITEMGRREMLEIATEYIQGEPQ